MIMDLARLWMYSMEVITVWILMTFKSIKCLTEELNSGSEGRLIYQKHFTNCCKEITQGLMGFCGKQLVAAIQEGFVIV